MSILIVLAATAIAAITATFITLVIVYKTDTDLHDQLRQHFNRINHLHNRLCELEKDH